MKRIRMKLLIVLLSAIVCNSLYSQAVYDSVDFKKIRVNGFYFGSKKPEMEKKFGEPQKAVTTEGAKGMDLYTDYHYSKSTLRISPAGFFNGFKLTENEFILGVNQHLVRVGDSMKEFALYFPQSFQSYVKDNGGKFKLKIRPGNTYIVFKTKDGIVDEIETKEEIL